MKTLNISPKIKLTRPKSNWRTPFYRLAQHQYTDYVVMAAIIINTIVLSVKWVGQPDIVTSVVEILNFVFTTFFIIEASVKIIGYGRKYF